MIPQMNSKLMRCWLAGLLHDRHNDCPEIKAGGRRTSRLKEGARLKEGTGGAHTGRQRRCDDESQGRLMNGHDREGGRGHATE